MPPDPDTLATLDETATSPAAAPETGGVEGLNAPEGGADSSGVATEAESPVLPNPQALAPMAPQDPDTLSISTEPAQPPEPQAESGPFETTGVAPAVPDAPEQPATPAVAQEGETPGADDIAADATPVAPESETPVQTTGAEQMPQAPEPETAEIAPQAEPETPPVVAETPLTPRHLLTPKRLPTPGHPRPRIRPRQQRKKRHRQTARHGPQSARPP
ncbi:hypothetical protein ACFQFQ_08815 [Sulfitobacter porphyrae]|uniref:Uncharacterized protein n=1 Tax=Sulfitobacter porphyrae TaxID=1246864 RepID=A0ABW2B1X8_9RHOB